MKDIDTDDVMNEDLDDDGELEVEWFPLPAAFLDVADEDPDTWTDEDLGLDELARAQ